METSLKNDTDDANCNLIKQFVQVQTGHLRTRQRDIISGESTENPGALASTHVPPVVARLDYLDHITRQKVKFIVITSLVRVQSDVRADDLAIVDRGGTGGLGAGRLSADVRRGVRGDRRGDDV